MRPVAKGYRVRGAAGSLPDEEYRLRLNPGGGETPPAARGRGVKSFLNKAADGAATLNLPPLPFPGFSAINSMEGNTMNFSQNICGEKINFKDPAEFVAICKGHMEKADIAAKDISFSARP